MLYKVEEHLNLYGELGIIIRLRIQSSIYGSDETHDFESLGLSRSRWISDGPPR